VSVLGYRDKDLDRVPAREVTDAVVSHLRRIRPHVVATFAPDGAYGHPDHVAICQITTAAVAAAADPSWSPGEEAHRVSKLYYIAWSAPKWDAYQAAFKKLVSHVDGVERQAAPWPDWEITTVIDTVDHWPTVWRAVQCHESQMAIYGPLAELSEAHHRGLWGTQEYYRAMSLVNGGRERETDLFAGLR
jgi:LmbE family N-acetylglucosaminyl deacetylase